MSAARWGTAAWKVAAGPGRCRTRQLAGAGVSVATAAPTNVAATATMMRARISSCWRHSRRNRRQAQRTMARRARGRLRRRPAHGGGRSLQQRGGHRRGDGLEERLGARRGQVWSTTRPSRRNTTRSAHEASWASWVTTTAATPRLAGGQDQAHHRLAVGRVEGTGGLVGQQQVALADHGPGDRHPLAFAAGQLVGEVRGPIGQAELSRVAMAAALRLLGRDAVELEREGDVLHRGEPGQEVEVLEHVADRAPPQPGPVVAGHLRQRGAADQHLAAGGVLQAAGDGQQGALARSARPHHRHQRAGLDRQVDLVQGLDLGRPLRRRPWHTS